MKLLSLPYLIIGLLITLGCNIASAQSPVLQISNNPTTCNGSEGSITFNGLAPNTSYQVTYIDGGITKGPVTINSGLLGQVVITGLNAGIYTGFTFSDGTNTVTFVGGVPLSDPIFFPTFNPFPPICAGDPPPSLPGTSNNGFPGTWNPGVVNNQTSGQYTFTPNPGTCALPVTISIVVNPKTEPVFPFGTGMVICNNGSVPLLSNTSTNGITGTWNPAVVDPTRSATYTFTPTTTGCVTGTTFTLVVNPTITPSFSLGAGSSICPDAQAPVLPTTSANGITGTWNPAIVDNKNSGTYTFTPDPGQCAIPAVYTQTVNPIIPPVFTNLNTAPVMICAGGTPPVLPATSDNGITGTWSPAVVSNTKSDTYTFTPASDPCAPKATVTVTVNPVITPEFSFGSSQSVCINATPPALPTASTNGITGTWSPATVDNQTSATYTFTPDAGQCANNATFYYEVNPIPSFVNVRADADTTVNDGEMLPAYDFNTNIPVTSINWTNSNALIGLPASGKGTVPSFKATNMTNDTLMAIITATPYVNGCAGAALSYIIKVRPLDKDIFVPNAFSPNGVGKNELLYVYSNYIQTLEMHIFNQWGQKMITITDKNQGWDGKFKGSPQPVGVYVYVLKAVMTDGRQINKKGSITLVR